MSMATVCHNSAHSYNRARTMMKLRAYVGHVEQGESNLTLTSIVILCEALDAEPSDLVAGLRSDDA